jgi:hypothetical protein
MRFIKNHPVVYQIRYTINNKPAQPKLTLFEQIHVMEGVLKANLTATKDYLTKSIKYFTVFSILHPPYSPAQGGSEW